MEVVISTIGRFHSFDLAREMLRRGALKVIFTGYPRFKLNQEGIPQKQIKTFPWIQAPYMVTAPGHNGVKRFVEWQSITTFDNYVSSRLPDCDVFVALSSCGLKTGYAAQRKGSKYVCDRGSSHIRFQDQILREEYDRIGLRWQGVDTRVIEREEQEYDRAHAITVPSRFVHDSFVRQGVDARKLKMVPYGVDLSRFFPMDRPAKGEFQVLFVGTISVRKGFAYLVEAFKNLHHPKKSLVIVGKVESNCEKLLKLVAARPDVRLLGHLPQPKLKDIMSRSHVMVLPSLEEGLALVQAQAMACGCPVIGSAHTGAADLFADGVEGYITPIRDTDAITRGLQALADEPELRNKMSESAQHRVRQLGGWGTYGERIYSVFQALVEGPSVRE